MWAQTHARRAGRSKRWKGCEDAQVVMDVITEGTTAAVRYSRDHSICAQFGRQVPERITTSRVGRVKLNIQSVLFTTPPDCFTAPTMDSDKYV